MKLQTKYFGEVDYESAELICFPEGLPGFQEEREFLLLPFADSASQLLCLQSAHTPALAFILLDPFSLCPDYAPELQQEELKALGVEKAEDLVFYVLCAVHSPASESTVNLRCPLAIHPHTLQGRQIIMDPQRYAMRSPLSSFGGGGDPC